MLPALSCQLFEDSRHQLAEKKINRAKIERDDDNQDDHKAGQAHGDLFFRPNDLPEFSVDFLQKNANASR